VLDKVKAKVACLGLAFKPDIDDLRESPAVEITKQVARLGCQVLAVEPNIEALPQKLAQPGLAHAALDDALATADVVCVLVKHRPFIEAVDAIRQVDLKIDAVGLLA
jgi:UDP-N-acetyl-D-mannosaminuronic acid dehydrogenase